MFKCLHCGCETEGTCGTLLCEECYEILICKNEEEEDEE